MQIKTYTTSNNSQLVKKIGDSITPIQSGQLFVIIYMNGVVVFDIAGSSFELFSGTQIRYQTGKDFKRSYYFVSDAFSGTILILNVNENYDTVDKIFNESIKLIPFGNSSNLLNSTSFKSISKSDRQKIRSIKFTESKTIGGSVNSISNNIPQSTSQNATKLSEQTYENQNKVQNALGFVPKGAQTFGQGVISVGKTVGQTTGNVVGGIVGGLSNIGQGLFNGVKKGINFS